MVYYQKFITRQDLRNNPDKQYLFGDNLKKYGMGGQARHMRGEPNAFGIPTKKAPMEFLDSYFTDVELDLNKKAIDEAFAKLDFSKDIIIPEAGLGTGLAELDKRAPLTFMYLQRKIKELEQIGYLV